MDTRAEKQKINCFENWSCFKERSWSGENENIANELFFLLSSLFISSKLSFILEIIFNDKNISYLFEMRKKWLMVNNLLLIFFFIFFAPQIHLFHLDCDSLTLQLRPKNDSCVCLIEFLRCAKWSEGDGYNVHFVFRCSRATCATRAFRPLWHRSLISGTNIYRQEIVSSKHVGNRRKSAKQRAGAK